MKIYLDDVRTPYKGWTLVKSFNEFVRIVSDNKHDITDISFDHDLGTEKTGYDALTWLEKMIYLNNYPVPDIHIHTANPVGRKRMEQVIKSIRRK